MLAVAKSKGEEYAVHSRLRATPFEYKCLVKIYNSFPCAEAVTLTKQEVKGKREGRYLHIEVRGTA